MAKTKEPSPWLLPRIAAVLVLFLTLVACGLEGMAVSAINIYPEKMGPLPSAVAVVVLTLAGGLATATILECFARLGAGIRTDHPDATTAASPVLDRSLDAINDSLARLEVVLPPAIAASLVAVLPTPAEGDPAGSSPVVEEHLAAMIKLLEEMKELSMLDENQRQTRRQQIVNRRKASRLDEVDKLIAEHSWQQADALLHLLDSLTPGDADVQSRRSRMDDARNAQLAFDWEQLSRQVEDQMALGRFNEALAQCDAFRQNYPAHQPGTDLADRVRREAEVYIDRAVTRAFEEIRTAVDARQWRSALMGTQRFLERFPDHPRSDKIRQQVRVIQKNAEVEERQEQEEQITQLIKSRRYGEALAVAEDLLARFPESPQAGRMAELLPRLREKAAEAGDVLAS
jgi:hypothetical protein